MKSTPTICIDPGHGGEDVNGAVYFGVCEDELNLNISYHVRYLLERKKYNVVMTRDTDVYVSLSSRVRIAEYQKADAFVSIHCNAFSKPVVHGIEILVGPLPTTGDCILAKHMSRTMKRIFPDHRHRDTRKKDLCVLRESDMPSILIECEFLSNPAQAVFLKRVENQKRLGECIAQRIIRFVEHDQSGKWFE